MAYTVRLKRSAAKALRELPRAAQIRIGKRLDDLSADPLSGEARKLTGGRDLYRTRAGGYRIVYEV